MSDGPQSVLKPEIRQLPQAVHFFLRHATPQFSIEKCVDAFILTLAELIPHQHLVGYLWQPDRQTNHRTRLTLDRGLVLHEDEIAPEAQVLQSKADAQPQDDLGLTLHRSLKTLQYDAAARNTLENHSCRAGIEIRFAYYSWPILRVIVGLSNAKLLPSGEAQDFLVIFCRCFLVSLHGAYLAELDDRKGLREKAELSERFKLTLQWFHSIVRHISTGLTGIQNGHAEEAEDALQRASIVAGVCLAEILSMMAKVQSSQPL
jgi:hypothetical protein